MKIRNGFVTNSSSSSFLISLKKEDYNKVYEKANDFYDFSKKYLLKEIIDNSTNIIEKDVDIIDFLKEQNCYDDIQVLADDTTRKEYENYLKYLDNNILLYLSDVNDCTDLYHMIRTSCGYKNGPQIIDEY